MIDNFEDIIDDDKSVKLSVLLEKINNLCHIASEILPNISIRKSNTLQHVLPKVLNNIKAIIAIGNNKWTAAPKQLLYRSILVDTNMLLCFLSITDEEFEKCMKIMNISHVKFMNEVLPMRKELAEILLKRGNFKSDDKSIEEIWEKTVSQYREIFVEYIKGNSTKAGKLWEIKSQKELGINNCKIQGNDKDFFTFFANKDDEDTQMKYAYLSYKYYSQTEHYSEFGCLYPFNLKNHGDQATIAQKLKPKQ